MCGVADDTLKREIASSLVQYAKEMRCIVIAEGVETKEEFEAMKDMGVDLAQGYHICRPGPAFPEPEVSVSG